MLDDEEQKEKCQQCIAFEFPRLNADMHFNCISIPLQMATEIM